MTIVPFSALTPIDLRLLGNNFDDPVRRDQDDIDAMNRSLATLGEELDNELIEAACRSEHIAG